MNVSSSLIIVSIIIVALVLLFAVGITETTPMFTRNDFDNIGDRYLKTVTIKGNLTSTEKNNLINELQTLKFENVKIEVLLEDGSTAPSNVAWGSSIKLKITADYIYDSIKSDTTKESKKISAVYENSTIVFGLEN